MRRLALALLVMSGHLLLVASARAADPATPTQDAAAEPKILRAEEDGTVTLHARDATVHGKTLRYEPQPKKNTLGFWTKPEDWASWEFEITTPGSYRIEALQGCGRGSGGAMIDVSVTDEKGEVGKLEFEVRETGHFQNFVTRDLGTLKLERAGRFTLSVKPRTKPGAAVMDLRQMTLRLDAK